MKYFLIIGFVLSFHAMFGQASQGMIAHYPMDGNGREISGNGLDLVAIGGVEPTSDVLGVPCRAMHFNGYDGYMTVNRQCLMSISLVFIIGMMHKAFMSALCRSKK